MNGHPLLFAVAAGFANVLGALAVTSRRSWNARSLHLMIAPREVLVEQDRLDGKHLDVAAMPPAPVLAAVVDAVVAQLSLEAADPVSAEHA